MKHDVSITIDGKNVALPVLEASAGLDVVDVRGLINEGLFTFDPGFLSTASCESKITYIDGDAGVLTYRGYPIEALANGAEHLEVCYLLLHGSCRANRRWISSKMKSMQECRSTANSRKFLKDSLHPHIRCPCFAQVLADWLHYSMKALTFTTLITAWNQRCS